MEVVLHIGQSKTGTSAIQAFFTLNRKELSSAGILYPPVNIGVSKVDIGNHNFLADTISGKLVPPFLSVEECHRQLVRTPQERGINRLVISGEHFFGGEPRIWDVRSEDEYFQFYKMKVQRVGEFFGGLPIMILVYLRPQVDWLESAISQTIRIQSLLSKPHVYRNDRQFFNLVRPLLRYGTLLEIWRAAMPQSQIVAVPYVRSQLIGRNSVSDFLYRANIDGAGLSLGKMELEVNESIALDFLEVKKQLNLIEHSSAREHAYIKCLSKLSKNSKFTSRYVVAKDIVDSVKELAEGENEVVNEKYISGGRLEAVGDRREVITPSAEDVAIAAEHFKEEFRRIRYRVMEWDVAARALLRRRVPAVHGLLHSMKRAAEVRSYRKR